MAEADLFLDVMAVEGEALEEDFFADFGTVLFFGEGDFLVPFRLFWGEEDDEEDELEEEEELEDDELVDPLSAYL